MDRSKAVVRNIKDVIELPAFIADVHKHASVILRVHNHRHAELPNVRGTFNLIRLLLNPVQGRQQNCNQSGNDSDDNKQLYQSESFF